MPNVPDDDDDDEEEEAYHPPDPGSPSDDAPSPSASDGSNDNSSNDGSGDEDAGGDAAAGEDAGDGGNPQAITATQLQRAMLKARPTASTASSPTSTCTTLYYPTRLNEVQTWLLDEDACKTEWQTLLDMRARHAQ